MKPLLAFVVLVSLGGGAMAKPAPVEPVRLTHSPNDTGMSVGPAGAMLESDYFSASQQPITTGRVFPCRLQLQVFDKTQIAQSCR